MDICSFMDNVHPIVKACKLKAKFKLQKAILLERYLIFDRASVFSDSPGYYVIML